MLKSDSSSGREGPSARGQASGIAAHSVHPEYSRLFRVLDDNGIPFCLIRPAAGLDNPHGDLDLLVSPDHRSASLSVFRALGYQLIRTERANPGKIVVVRWDGTHAFYLDVHYAVVIQGFEYLDARRVVSGAVRRFGPPVADDPDLALILLLHDVIGKRRVQPKYHDELRSLWQTVPASSALEDARGRGMQGLLPETPAELECVFDDRTAEALATRLRHAMRRHPRTRANRLRVTLYSRLPSRRRGTVVALLGPDGSGKSSTVSALKEVVERELRWPASVVYMGPWGHDRFDVTSRMRYPPPDSWQEIINRRRDRLAAGERKARVGEALALELRRCLSTARDAESARRVVVRDTASSWMIFGWLRGHVRYWMFLTMLTLELGSRYLHVWRHKRRGRMVICDRYVYDLMTGEMHSINPRYRWARTLICNLFPRPDVSVLLWNDAEQLHARKQQLSRVHLQSFLDFYATLEARYGFEKVQTDVPPAQVARRIVDLIFARAVEARRC